MHNNKLLHKHNKYKYIEYYVIINMLLLWYEILKKFIKNASIQIEPRLNSGYLQIMDIISAIDSF